MLRSTSVVITTTGASPLMALSPVSSPTVADAVAFAEVAELLVRQRLERRGVEGPPAVAPRVSMPYSATTVLPLPVGAATTTWCPASSASRASSWKRSSGNG